MLMVYVDGWVVVLVCVCGRRVEVRNKKMAGNEVRKKKMEGNSRTGTS